ncbi:MAG: hypothetical protein A4E19_17775 [Nitrospira sp. SG-bin1]|nr:MAG: hypothetical protein A4E19_17775 [Nitrospira sp. SG-bin1]
MTTRIVLMLCATVVIGGSFLTVLANGPGNAEEMITLNDAWLTAKTKTTLFTDARVRGREINVESVQGVVMIRGQVDSDKAKQTVEDLAKGIGGVRWVKNDLQVVLPSKRDAVHTENEVIATRDQAEPCQDRVN